MSKTIKRKYKPIVSDVTEAHEASEASEASDLTDLSDLSDDDMANDKKVETGSNELGSVPEPKEKKKRKSKISVRVL